MRVLIYSLKPNLSLILVVTESVEKSYYQSLVQYYVYLYSVGSPQIQTEVSKKCFNLLRNRAVRLLWQYISRTHKVEAHGFRLLKMEGYVLLANQLHQFDATEAVVDACLSIVHNRAIVLDECPEIPSHIQVVVLFYYFYSF